MEKYTKRIVALMLVLVMLVSTLPISAFAASNPITVRVQSTDGTAVAGATITAYAYYTIMPERTFQLTCQELGDGRY